MSNETAVGIVVTFLLASYVANDFLVKLRGYLQYRRNLRTLPNVESVKSESELCKMHEWEKVTLALGKLEAGVYRTCLACGFVGGTKYKLNSAAKEVMHSHIAKIKARREKREKVLAQMQEARQADMKRLVGDALVQLNDDASHNCGVLKELYYKSVMSAESTAVKADEELEGNG